jgi:glucans biosynthesis protein C
MDLDRTYNLLPAMRIGPKAQRTSARFEDVDALRGTLMMMAVLLHVCTVYATSRATVTANTDRLDFFSWMVGGLHLFVTPSFFVISGFVTARMMAEQPLVRVARERAKRLLIPMVSVALTFNVVELFLRYRDSGGPLGFPAYLSSPAFADLWQTDKWALHLWFLLSLSVFVTTAISIAAIMSPRNPVFAALRRLADKLGSEIESTAGFIALILGLAAANLLISGIAAKIPGGYEPLLPGLQSPYKLAQSLPYFAFGLWLSGSGLLQHAVLRFRLWMMGAAVIAFVVQPYLKAGSDFWRAAAILYGQDIVCWISVFAGLQGFHRYFNQPSAWRRKWVDRAQSMFLFHHGLVYIFGTLLVLVHLPVVVEFFLLMLAVVGAVVILHDFVVMRIPLVCLLFNGRGSLRHPLIRPSPMMQAAE